MDSAIRADIEKYMRAAGYSDATIAKELGISRQAVHARMGPRPKDPNVEDRRRGMNIERANQQTPVPEGTTNPNALLPSTLLNWRAKHNFSQSVAANVLQLATVSTYSRWERTGECSLAGLVLEFLKLYDKANT